MWQRQVTIYCYFDAAVKKAFVDTANEVMEQIRVMMKGYQLEFIWMPFDLELSCTSSPLRVSIINLPVDLNGDGERAREIERLFIDAAGIEEGRNE